MKKIKKTILGLTALALVTGTAVTLSTIAKNNNQAVRVNAETETYNGFEVIDDIYNGYRFKYSDGFFINNPETYDYHMATMSACLTHASDTVKDGQDYSRGAITLENLYKKMKYQDIYTTESYKVKPTTDSIAAVIASKYIDIKGKMKLVVSLTVRSASYELEWASNVTLGTEGEAKGFSEAATQLNKELENYLKDINAYTMYINGNVKFWISGYSRGGATANLLAKRVVDRYERWHNDVYAYCVEAPQGGIARNDAEEKEYLSIHNVINVDDLVPYVAPTAMGFRRYGVDHYLFGGEATKNIRKSPLNENNLCDNDPINEMSKEQKKELDRLLPQTIRKDQDINKYKPYTITRKNFKLLTFSIKDSKYQDEKTSTYINRFINGLVKNGRGVSRLTYATGLEQRARHVMQYLYARDGFDKLKDTLLWKDFVKAVPVALCEVAKDCKVMSRTSTSAVGIAWDAAFGETTLLLDADSDMVYALAEGLAQGLVKNKALMDELEQYYPGGKTTALTDIHALIINLLRVHVNLDDILTMVYNAESLLQNHTQLLTIALLKTQDNWW